jgi:hypothetical protein
MTESAPDRLRNGRLEGRVRSIAERLGLAFLRRLFVVGILSVLITIGLFLVNISRNRALFYWSAMFPVFGLACLGHELIAARGESAFGWRMLGRQAAHWLGPIVAVKIVFLQLERGMFDAPAAALSIVLLLAVTCFLAGVHFDYVFLWLSLFLGTAAIVGAEIQAYIWIIAGVAIAAAIVGIAAAMMIRSHSHAAAPGA